MTRALHALSLALGDLVSRRVLRVLAQSLALTLLLFLIAGGALVLAGRGALGHGGWLDGAGLDLASALFALILVAGRWMLFRAGGIAVAGLFADAIVADVEARHYTAPPARAPQVEIGEQPCREKTRQ